VTPSPVYGPRPVKPRRTRAALRAVDNAIINAVQVEHPVTLRGVFYRVVSAGAVEKSELGYECVKRELLKLRRDGIVPYDWITDGTRWISKPPSYDGVEDVLEAAAASYRRALWHDQAAEVQIYSEKDAISGTVLPVTERWDVPLGIVRGYASETFAWSVAQSILAASRRGKSTYVYQLGDHDPSGVDAWRSFQERVTGFLCEETIRTGASASFARLAVTPEQITGLNLPTRPTKRSDSRAAGFGGDSVEVDAIPPTILRGLVEDAITSHIDSEALRLTRLAEQSEREILYQMTEGIR
jgi:hypothetical protein